MGIVPGVAMWQDVGNMDGVVCGEMLAQVYSVEPETLMWRDDSTLQGISYIMINSGATVLMRQF